MKLSKDNPIVHFLRWVILRRNLQRIVPSTLKYGGWLLFLPYYAISINFLLLTTTGRKTGIPRQWLILYVKQGQDYIISAHQAGHDKHPSWFLNLVANPIVTVELFWKHRMYKAEQVSDEEERKALLAQFPYGLVDAYQELTTRTIPVIRLHPL